MASSINRRAGIVAFAAAVSLTLAACSGGSGSTSGDGEAVTDGSAEGQTLSVWIMEGTNPDPTAFFDEVSAAFTEQTGAELDIQFVPWTAAHDNFTNAIAGGTGPDVAEVGNTWTSEFGDAGAFMDLTDYIDGAGLTDVYNEALTESGTYDGAVYGAPWYAGVRGLVYRTDLLEAAGLEAPTTWDEIVSVGTALKEANPDIIPFPVPASVHATTPFIWGAGGDVATEDGGTWTSALTEPGSIEGLTFLSDLVHEHGLSTPAASTWNEADTRDAFARGEAAMIVAGSWTPASILEAAPDLEGKIGVSGIPGKDGGLSPSFVGGSHLAVFETTENPDLAWTFVEMMTTGEFAEKWGQQSGFFPGNSELLDKIQSEDDPLVAPFAEQMNDAGGSLPVTPKWGQVEGAQILPAMMQTILGSAGQVDSAAKTASDEMNEIFGQ